MNTLPSALGISLLLASTQAFSWGGPVMDTYGNRITAVTGECYYYGDIGASACDTDKDMSMDTMADTQAENKKAMAAAPVAPAAKKDMATSESEVKNIIKLDDVTFKTGSDQLNATSHNTLDNAAQTLINNGDVQVVVAGHTDNTGNALNNLKLSEKRAISVKNYLANKGVNPDNLTARGYGDAQPIASNDNATGRSQNRRVELRILK